MTQLYILGSSTAYGVGGEGGGWGDLIKQELHRRNYGPQGHGEVYEVFNFAKSGAKIQFVIDSFPSQFAHYSRPNTKSIALVAVGDNNAKANGQPDNFVSTLDAYLAQMSQLLQLLTTTCDVTIAVGSGFVDETKTSPKINPLSGNKSYFSNQRRIAFESAWANLCGQLNVPFVGVDVSVAEWQHHYLYQDGLHPNAAGHHYIARRVLTAIDSKL